MFITTLFFVTLSTYLCVVTCEDEPFHGKVAFYCGRPSLYWINGAWKRDDNQGCLSDLNDIREYCRRVYPQSIISNVEPATENEEISGWCVFGDNNCVEKNKLIVRPYLCLAGQYQSPALLVPEKCTFGHVTKDMHTDCQPVSHWNATAQRECAARTESGASKVGGMVMRSFGLLLPCQESQHAGWFAGVEYVCCPNSAAASSNAAETRPLLRGQVALSPAAPHKNIVPKKGVPEGQAQDDAVSPLLDAYQSYLRQVPDNELEEHDRYQDAKRELRARLLSRRRQLELELRQAEEQIGESMQRDPDESKRFMLDVEARFAKNARGIREDDIAEKHQLDDVHQHRIQVRLNELKQRARDAATQSLQVSKPQEKTVAKAFERLLRLHMKDKVHVLNHFEHVQLVEPERAAQLLSETRDHLSVVDTQIADALNLLATRSLPFSVRLKQQLLDFIKDYDDVEENQRSLAKIKKSDLMLQATNSAAKHSFDTLLQEYHRRNMAMYHAVKMTLATASPVAAAATNQKKEVHVEPVISDVEPAQPVAAQARNDQQSRLYVDAAPESIKEAASLKSEFSLSAVSGICAGSVAVVLLILLGMIAWRRRRNSAAASTQAPAALHNRSRRHGAKNGSAAYHMSVVEQDAEAVGSPEEKHLAAMQSTGYENPTYKYFEVNNAVPMGAA